MEPFVASGRRDDSLPALRVRAADGLHVLLSGVRVDRCCGHVAAAFLGNPPAEAEQCGLRRDLSCDQALPLAEGNCAVDKARGTNENAAWVKAASTASSVAAVPEHPPDGMKRKRQTLETNAGLAI